MTFKEFLAVSEAGMGGGGGSDNGLMGYPLASSVRKPSDGLAFKDKLGCAAGQTPRGPGSSGGGMGGMTGAPMFMKKRMKKS